MRSNVDIVRASFQAYVDKDRDALEAIIADDFHFSSPLDNRIDRKTYFERCWPNSETAARFDEKHVLEQGDTVTLTYEGHSTKGDIFRNTEVFTLRDGQIVEVEVYFGWNVPHKAPPGRFITEPATHAL